MTLFRVLTVVLLTPAFGSAIGPMGKSLAANDIDGGHEPAIAVSYNESTRERASKLPRPEELDVILHRPLFFEGRSPKATESRLVSRETLPLNLKGIIVLDDQKRAIFSQENENRTVQLTLGMTHNGWSLVQIRDNHVDLQRGAERVRLSLNFKNPTRPTSIGDGDLGSEQGETQKQDNGIAAQTDASPSDSATDELDHDLMDMDKGPSKDQ